MKVLFLETPYTFSLIPRVYPLESDTLILSLRNEITDTVSTPDITFTVTDKVNVTIVELLGLKSKDKFEIELKNGSEIIYLGKLIVLDENTNVQNYEYGSQQNARFDYK